MVHHSKREEGRIGDKLEAADIELEQRLTWLPAFLDLEHLFSG